MARKREAYYKNNHVLENSCVSKSNLQSKHCAYSQKAYSQISVVYFICPVRENINNRSEYQVIGMLKVCALAHSHFDVFYVNVTQASKTSAIQQ